MHIFMGTFKFVHSIIIKIAVMCGLNFNKDMKNCYFIKSNKTALTISYSK